MGVKLVSNLGGSIEINAPATTSTFVINAPASNGTMLTTATAGVPINGPLFYATQSAQVIPSSNTTTKITINTVIYDTNSRFITATNRFNPNVAGFYQINGSAVLQGSTSTNLSDIAVLKNGGTGLQGSLLYNGGAAYTTAYCNVCGIIYMNGTTDYLELFGRVIGSGTLTITNGVFNGALVRAA
jgi:hypothetical protein